MSGSTAGTAVKLLHLRLYKKNVVHELYDAACEARLDFGTFHLKHVAEVDPYTLFLSQGLVSSQRIRDISE